MRYLIIFAATLITSSCIGEQKVAIPNAEALGMSVISANIPIMTNSDQSMVLPKELRLIVSNGIVDEVQAVYSSNISFSRIVTSINSRYSNSEMKDVRSIDFGLWKVPTKQFVIQLSVFKGEDISIDKGDRVLILTRDSTETLKNSKSVSPHH